MQSNNSPVCLVLTTAALILVAMSLADANLIASASSSGRQQHLRLGRGANLNNHHQVMHSHMSRKVFDRACAASKDTLDDIIKCLVSNKHLMEAIKRQDTLDCHKEAFGVEFDPADAHKHKDLICNNRDKFEDMTACVYRKTAEANLDQKEIDKLTESMVDVGLCIINALD